MYLPLNVMAILQPMDQGVLEALKRSSKKSLVRQLLTHSQTGQSIVDLVKTINIEDVV